MELSQHNVFDTGRRVQTLLDSESAVFGTAVPAPLRAQLDTAMTQLAASGQDQESLASSVRGEAANQVTMRKALKVDFLTPMGRIARHALGNSPDFEALVVPASVTRKGDFMNKVNAVAGAAAKHEKDFVDHGMPADFIARTNAAADALLASVTARKTHRGQRGGATLGLKDKLSEGRALVLVLDAFVQTALKDDPALLANWNIIKRVRLVARRQLHTPDTPATTPATPAPGTSQAA